MTTPHAATQNARTTPRTPAPRTPAPRTPTPPTSHPWDQLTKAQRGMLARRQLRALGITRGTVRAQLDAGRWARRSDLVVSTFTGRMDLVERAWLGVLHAGGDALVGGITTAGIHGLARWERADVTILVDELAKPEAVRGIRFVRTRRDLRAMRDPAHQLPLCRVAPAVLLHGAYSASQREALGLLAAVVQQGLTTPQELGHWLEAMAPLRRARRFRSALADIAGGAGSLAEIDIVAVCRRFGLVPPNRQRPRRDSRGRRRYTDCEWDIDGGLIVALEIDGAFHMTADHWEADIVRERGLANPNRVQLRCTARELRDDPRPLVRDLLRLGVPRS